MKLVLFNMTENINQVGMRQKHDLKNHEDFFPSNETVFEAYTKGVNLGIINTEKYPLEVFQNDEENIFRNIYKEYNSIVGRIPLNYEEWLVMNNFGILPDTQESIYQPKYSTRNVDSNRRQRFTETLKMGDILITGQGIISGIIGHSAIMTSDDWVLEMIGGDGWDVSIKDNNRKVSKSDWYRERSSNWINVYRCKDESVAREAAVWADHTYYNPNGGLKKIKHITFQINTDKWSINPTYCSKLVVHAYHFGTGRKKVIKDLSLLGLYFVPVAIPSYFLSPYTLENKGKF